MQTACPNATSLLRLLSTLRSWLAGRMFLAVLAETKAVARAVLPVMTRAWIASMGQPSPGTGFALAIMLELGGCLLRVPGIRRSAARSVRAAGIAVAAAIFRLSAYNENQVAGLTMPASTVHGPGPSPLFSLRRTRRGAYLQQAQRRAS